MKYEKDKDKDGKGEISALVYVRNLQFLGPLLNTASTKTTTLLEQDVVLQSSTFTAPIQKTETHMRV